MDAITGSLIYICIWVVVFFMALPIGVQRDGSPDKGCDPGAPRNARVGLKLGITTLVAGVLWGGVKYMIEWLG
jgi:predicted secreted protein